ncbi:uncharacterized protein LOC133194326 [Saccostrea echinata]|uniref:uncharacterized protein LOC133194326 n=1 Tax=Saccostrea echinata TaxID=191078 RepID=UPI002A826226|nr:uncharacterized protein LOC133194326 [Saccostrea echinata]
MGGFHDTTEKGDLLFVDQNEYKVKMFSNDGDITTLFTTEWKPYCIHYSRINGEIFLGQYTSTPKDKFLSKVTRHDSTGWTQVIEKDKKGRRLYVNVPQYITENKNRDIWTSCISGQVVVVDTSGRHRFNYTGQKFQSYFRPSGISTDNLGQALVCNCWVNSASVHLLDQDGLVEKTFSILSSPIQLSTIIVPGASSVNHMSLDTSDRLWAHNCSKELLHVHRNGTILHNLPIRSLYSGFHDTTEKGELLFVDIHEQKVKKFGTNGNITTLLTTEWEPYCIHYSRINGDIILIQFTRISKGKFLSKVTRHDSTGWTKVIENDTNGRRLYEYVPQYITENKNGDILTSSWGRVVVVDSTGRRRFIYTGQQFQSQFSPRGICTDILGQILVCNSWPINPSVHLLDQDGQFLRLLLTSEDGIRSPSGMCIDDKQNLYLGQEVSSTITVYKYLKSTED